NPTKSIPKFPKHTCFSSSHHCAIKTFESFRKALSVYILKTAGFFANPAVSDFSFDILQIILPRHLA
ncbi:MAG: hypothetical protein RR625_03975, partial [Christensenellaceae bacterium]